MREKTVALIMLLLLAVSSFTVYGGAVTACPEGGCCCVAGAAGGDRNALPALRAQSTCCCGEGLPACSIRTAPSLDRTAWVLRSQRAEMSAPMPAGPARAGLLIPASMASSPIANALDIVNHPGTPPTYLSVMSFLC